MRIWPLLFELPQSSHQTRPHIAVTNSAIAHLAQWLSTANDSDEEAYDTYTGSGTNNRPGSGKAKPFTLDEDTYLDLIIVYCTAVSSGACTNFDLSYWRNQGDGFFVETLTLASGADPYLFSLPPSEGTYLPEFMVWNLKPDCPFCTAGQTEGDGGDPINTRNGNLSFDATDLSIPVLGGNLSFRRSYVSGGIDTYTQTLGYGWTHNFDMRLRLTNTHIIGTVELQTPGGNLLPFYVITSTPGVTTYVPYAGVMASLVEVTSTYVVTAFNQTTYVFNSQGQLIRQTDAFGNHLFFTYEGNDRLQTAYQGERALTYNYDGNGRLATVSDNITRTVVLLYDAAGDLVTVTLSASDGSLILTTIYEYDDHLLTEVIDPTGKTVMETQYDAENRAFKQWDGQGNLLYQADYTLAGTHIITENGVVMTHTYDARGTLIGVTYACAAQTPGCQTGNRQGFDGNFKPGTMRDANGQSTRVVWNGGTGGGSNVENVTNALNQTTDFDYDGLNNLAEIENARGYTTSYNYEDTDLPTFRTSSTDALQQTTIYTPTAAGLLEVEEDPNGLVTHYWYNAYGQVTQTVRAYGTSEAITMTYGYDAVGRLITTTQVSSDSDLITSLNVYDAANRLIATIQNWTGTDPATWQNECITTPGPRDTNICTRYGYDAAGRTISTTNTLGQTDLSFYDAAGRLYLRVGNYDGTANYQNDPVGVLCDWVTPDPENNLCNMTAYDSYGRVVSTTNVLGNVDRTFYDSLGRVQVTVVNSVNVTDDWEECDFPPTAADEDLCTVYTYDAVGNVVEVKDPAGRVTLTVYDQLNRVQGTIVNWDGLIDLDDCYTSTWLNQTERDENVCTSYVYDEVGNTTIVSDTLGRMSYTVYDELNRVEGTIGSWDGTIDLDDCWAGSLPLNRDNNVCTGFIYDAAGNQTVVTNTLGQMNLTVYDTAQRPIIQVTNWDGTSTTWPDDCANTASEPDATENLCTFTSYDSLGRRASTTDVMGHVTEFAYDGLGRVITTTRYLDSQPVETSVTYDALGNRLTQTDGEDHTVTTHYDTLNRPVVTISHEGVAITTTYNAASWVMGTINNLGHTTANDYDALGRLVVMTDGENHDTEYGYDALGNQIVMTDALGIDTVYGYDELNRLIAVTENETTNRPDHENNLFTQYRYDVLGNRVVITNALAITSSLTIYDTLNRPVSVKDALGNETQYQYNVLGQRTVMTDANGDITLYSYDDLNRLDTVSYETDNETVEYAYNALGNRTIMTDSLGVATYEYDDFSRVITVTSPLTGTVVYGYDTVGNRVELTYPNDYTVTYQYDGDNRLVEVVDWQEGITTYEYDPAGRLITTTLPNGVVTVNTYDDAHRLTNLTHEDGDSHLVASYTCELDDVGNRVVATETMRLPIHTLQETQTSPTELPLETNEQPAIAYNSEDNEYLVVWQGYHHDESAWFIYGQRVDSVGNLVGTVITITAKPATEPDVAYSPADDIYMVVFSQDGTVGAQLVNADGSITENPLELRFPGVTNSQPSVAYNSDDGSFSIAFINDDGHSYSVYVYKVSDDYLELVDSQTNEMRSPALAIAEDGIQLVVWQYDNGSDWDVYGHMLASNGTASGDVIEIADNLDNEMMPDVAWSEPAEAFLVVWHNHGGFVPQGVQGRRVLDDGSLSGSAVLYSETNTTSYPAVTATPTDWWIVWQQGNPAVLYGQQVLSNGTKEGDNAVFFTGSDNRTKPALTGGNVNGTMLLAWEDDRDSEDTIYHAVINTGSVTTTTIAYTYDPLYRLVEADYSGNITANYLYTYDEVGSMVAYTETVGAELARVTRSFDDANQLQTSTMLDGPQLGTTSYYYDNNGNLSQILPPDVDPNEAGDQRYYYSQRNLLITSTVRGDSGWNDQATFTYDGLGNRVQQVDLTGSTPITTTYANDNLGLSQVLVAYSGNEETSNLFGLDLIQQDTGADTLILLTDGLGSVRLEMVEDTLNTATTYDPYGNQLVQTGMGNTTYGFTGEQEDNSTGLLYLRARYYDPALRNFVERDPWVGILRYPTTLHGYSYADNNPTNYTDPSGFCSQSGWNDNSGLFTEENCDRLESGDLEFTEQWYSDLADHFEDEYGLTQTAENFRHYLSGQGGERQLPESFVSNDILNIGTVERDINKLLKWYVRMHIDSLTVCVVTPVGPDVYANSYTPWSGYAQAASQTWLGTSDLDVAGALGSFRLDVELSGDLHRLTNRSTRTEANLDVHVVVLDVYDWHPGLDVTWFGNTIPDDWAHSLQANGLAANFITRGDYSYTYERTLAKPLFGVSDDPPGEWVYASCIGSQFDVSDVTGVFGVDYCGNPLR